MDRAHAIYHLIGQSRTDDLDETFEALLLLDVEQEEIDDICGIVPA